MRYKDQAGTAGDWSTTTDYFVMQIVGDYMAKVDDGSFMKYTLQSDNTWIAYDKRGWMYKFGTSTASQIYNTATTTQVFRWMLTEVRDPNGNRMLFNYTRDGLQIYPSQIDYTDNGGGAISQVTFAKSLRPTTDYATSSAYGFTVVTKYRVDTI